MQRIHRTVRFLIPICLLLCFIWGNSLMNGEESAQISRGLLRWLKENFPLLKTLPHTLLRKLGHFSEFGLLGFLHAWLFRRQGGYHRFTMPMLGCMLAANIDETIQVLVPGRGPSVVDVWIDVGGAVAGMLFFRMCLLLWRAIRKPKGAGL